TAGEQGGGQPGPYEILGLPVHPVGLEEAAALVTRWVQERDGASGLLRHVVTLNPEMVMRARKDPGLAGVVSRAELVVPDGIGVVWAARMLGRPALGRVPGVELAERCLRELARLNLPVFLVGGEPPGPDGPGVAEEAARRLQARPDLAGLRVAGTHHGYFAFGSDEEERLLRAIEAARPALLLVGMGVPRQEAWIDHRRERLRRAVRVAIGVGGSLDVWAGRTRRAPPAVRRLGLEWLFRAATQPWRLKRLAALPAFAGAVLGYRLGGIMGQRVRRKA
ncbi:MAG: WecB/TagA/CpsF family glycosyltransferase, partial [Bacillota bacterium]